jgi:hypothetical protein
MSTASTDDELSEVLKRVEQWPIVQRRTLALRLLEGLGEPRPTLQRPPMTIPLEKVRGILATDAPAPSDEECKQWIEDERVRKYGG